MFNINGYAHEITSCHRCYYKKKFLLLFLIFFVTWSPFPLPGKTPQKEVLIKIDGRLYEPSIFGLNKLTSALEKHKVKIYYSERACLRRTLLVGTLASSPVIQKLAQQKQINLSSRPESLAVKRISSNGQEILVVAGSDDRGLMYAFLELSLQISLLKSDQDWYSSVQEISQEPFVPIRRIGVFLHSQDCEKEWYYSHEFWKEYFDMLATNRWNEFNLIFSHQTPYLSPMYAFHVKVDQFPQIKARGLTEEQRKKNLEILQYISSLAQKRGLNFTLGIWEQIAWEGKHQGSRQESMVTGLTRQNMYAYTYHALLKLLQECPAIHTLQLRINHESGIDYDEQTVFFREAVFKAVKDCGRPINLEIRNVGLLRETLQAAVEMNLPVRVSHKYWGEHMVFPYHPTRIMWTYSYGDWLKYPRQYQNLFQVWSLGSHRLLLWGDPEYVRRFAPTTLFEDAIGFEIFAPLSQKGFGNPPGAWRIFRFKKREYYRWEYERYWSYYLLFGRLTYDPRESNEIWLREFRRRFGQKAASTIAATYRVASQIIPLILGTATCDYNMYIWPEKDMGGLIQFYLHFKSFNEPRIYNFQEFITNYLTGTLSAKLTPEDMAQRLETISTTINQLLHQADSLLSFPNKEYWATKKDFHILAGLAAYFVQKIRATYKLGFFYRLNDYTLLTQAINHAQKALNIWKKLSSVAEEIYNPKLIMGPGSYGHWKDNLVFVQNDLEQLLHQEKLFSLFQDFDFGYDFGPEPYNDVTTIYTPWYTNYYTVEHRFVGVYPHSLFNPQEGFGWNHPVHLTSPQPPKIPRTLWRASNLENLNIPQEALLSDFIQGKEQAVFRMDLPEGHYQATLIITDRRTQPETHGPMNIAVIERFGERPIIRNLVIKKGELIIKRFNFNMVGSRFSNFRLKFWASPGGDFIINGLTITRIEPHIAHLPLKITPPGRDIHIRATVTLPPQILQPNQDSLSIARGTTSTIDPPNKLKEVILIYSTDGGLAYSSVSMNRENKFVYSATIPGEAIQAGELLYQIKATDSIGQSVYLPQGPKENFFHVQVTNDAEPPQITHQPITSGTPGVPLKITAEINDASPLGKVILYYRPTRQAMEYSKITMQPEGKNRYSGEIPGEALTKEFDLIYYIEAVDIYGNGVFFPDPDREDPHLVVKVKR